jgi:hypothetical protein
MSKIKLELNKEYTGAEINATMVSDDPFVKLTVQDENHNGFVYHTGLNCDTLPFRPQGLCSAGGLYFCRLSDAPHWLDYVQNGSLSRSRMHHMRYVTLPDDARVFLESVKMKADKFILSDPVPIANCTCLLNATVNFFKKYGQIYSFTHFDPSLFTVDIWCQIIQDSHFRCVDIGLLSDFFDVPPQSFIAFEKYRTRACLSAFLLSIGKFYYTRQRILSSVLETFDSSLFTYEDMEVILQGIQYVKNVPEKARNEFVLCWFLRHDCSIQEAMMFHPSAFGTHAMKILTSMHQTRSIQQLIEYGYRNKK